MNSTDYYCSHKDSIVLLMVSYTLLLSIVLSIQWYLSISAITLLFFLGIPDYIDDNVRVDGLFSCLEFSFLFDNINSHVDIEGSGDTTSEHALLIMSLFSLESSSILLNTLLYIFYHILSYSLSLVFYVFQLGQLNVPIPLKPILGLDYGHLTAIVLFFKYQSTSKESILDGLANEEQLCYLDDTLVYELTVLGLVVHSLLVCLLLLLFELDLLLLYLGILYVLSIEHGLLILILCLEYSLRVLLVSLLDKCRPLNYSFH